MIYADAHNDLPSLLFEEKQGIGLDDMLKAGVAFTVFSIFTHPPRCNHFIDALGQIRLLIRQAEERGLHRYRRRGEEGAYTILLEGAENLGENEGDNIRLFRELGVRMVGLVWNRDNLYASSSMSREDKGLTQRGKRLIRHLNRAKIAIDLSHAGRETFFQAGEMSLLPCIATHSNAAAVCPHVRNLNDDQIRFLINTGGFMGLNFYQPFVGGKGDVEAYFAHIDHCMSLGGERAVGFGTDLNGFHSPQPLDSYRCLDRILSFMGQKGYSDELIQRIAYGNLMDFIDKNCNFE